MSTREYVHTLVDSLSETQLQGLIKMLEGYSEVMGQTDELPQNILYQKLQLGLQEIEDGKGIPMDEVFQEMHKRITE